MQPTLRFNIARLIHHVRLIHCVRFSSLVRFACHLVLGAMLVLGNGCSRTGSAPASTDELPPLPPEPDDLSLATTNGDSPSQGLGFAGPPAGVPNGNWPNATAVTPENALSPKTMSGLPIAAAADGIDPTGKPRLQLRSSLTPDQLIDFLAAADQDMELIYSGRSGLANQDEAITEMQRIIQAKLEASRRLVDNSDASPEQRTIGKRGELQALSHLASSGSLKSAEELETIATAGLASGEPTVVSDSRLVLIGFALEALQNGKDDAPKRIVELVEQHSPTNETADVPAMMVMGQARELLAQYGHIDEAKRVREAILKSFASSSDPDVAMMAAKLAGAVQFDGIDELRADAIADKPVDIAAWTAAAQQLIDESRDLLTVQYLASTALELEGTNNSPLAAATYELLAKNFSDSSESLGREVAVAIAANQSRQAILGAPFDVKLPSLEGETIEMSDYIGRVVLMPFWAAEFPASMQLFPNLIALREQHPNDIVIVGVNLDSRADERTANAKAKLGFPSLHSATDPSAEVPNPLVKKFGMVSMPFVVVLDRKGNVADICFTQRKLNQAIATSLATR